MTHLSIPSGRTSLLWAILIATSLWLMSGLLPSTGAAYAAQCNTSLPGSTPCNSWVFRNIFGEAGEGQSLVLLDYSLGINNENNCFSCNFVQQFLIALASFSAGVFMYFRAFFVTLMPIIMAIWIGVSVARVMIAGGDGGGAFFAAMVRKMTLFLMLWLVMMVASPTAPKGNQARNPSNPMPLTTAYAPWTWFGPGALTYGLELSNEVRTKAAENLFVGGSAINAQLGMNCRGVGSHNPVLKNDPTTYAFAYHASELACAIERIHIVGIASGIAMINGAWVSIDIQWDGVTGTIGNAISELFNALILSVFGIIIIGTYGLSMIWFTFLILDVVVKILIVAGISPLMMLFALLVPTRRYAVNALFQSLGAIATLLGIAFVAALSFFLIANVVDVYMVSKRFYDASLPDITRTNIVADLREFIWGMQIESGQPGHIPMNLTTPWFHYMLLTSLSITVLGKKIIAIIEEIMNVRGMAEMANNAKQIAVMGAALAGTTGYFMAKGGLWGLGQSWRTGSAAVGGGKTAIGLYQNARANGLRSAFDSVTPFGNNSTPMATSNPSFMRQMRDNLGKGAAGDPSILKKSMDMQNNIADTINKNNLDGEPK